MVSLTYTVLAYLRTVITASTMKSGLLLYASVRFGQLEKAVVFYARAGGHVAITMLALSFSLPYATAIPGA